MARLPKSLIKKYGISKKAWAVFRGQKSSSRLKTKKITRSFSMARKRSRFGKKGRSSTKGFSFGSVLKILGGAAVAAAYEVFVSPMIPLSQQIKNILELVIGLVVAVMPGMPMIVRAGGAALATINAYALVYPLIAGSGSSTSSNSNWATF